MKSKFLFIALFVLSCVSCETVKILNQIGNETVSPDTFKTTFPFTLPKNQSIHIITYWGAERKPREMKLDNHAPTAIDSIGISRTEGITRIGNAIVDKPTPDGRKIPNSYYKYDGIRIGDVTFNKVVINRVPLRNSRDTVIVPDDGLWGDNLMAKGIWKIDFEHMTITFASHIDSIEGVSEAELVSKKFTISNNIKYEVVLANGFRTTCELDLGYNGQVIIPKADFDKIRFEHEVRKKQGGVVTAAGKGTTWSYYAEKEKVQLGKHNYTATIAANDKNTRFSLLGLGFFSRFKFIIIDYPNKRFYISKALR